ncbi:MAG: sigma-70 family RNA polymerase sigma factor [Acidobacteria bacterium]|nr:sigma-70 family RNA polymerase sigma factor [Acidobacteriota bacterium]
MSATEDYQTFRFRTTRWRIVVAARDTAEPSAREAMASLCQTYWPPLYAYIRRKGYSHPEAQDLTQGFFTRLLEKHYLKDYQREKGRFRTFLIAALKHFIANEWQREHALKRAGDVNHESIDILFDERAVSLVDDKVLTPEEAYERQWGVTLLTAVRVRLKDYYNELGKGELFARLRFAIDDTLNGEPYAGLARDLGTTVGAVKVWIHRIRKRYRDYLREEISATVADPDEIEDELQHLLAVLSG